ncbi:MAG: efflux RND transporter permease subunit, partial [Endomicrobium sp.]|nr:efflux RND transporter permease subunit [Endomicrobium sp.]
MSGQKKSIIELALIYRQIPIVLAGFLCLIGVYSFFTMSRQEFPEFKARQGLVIAAYPGASSQQVDLQLAKPLQDYLFGYKEINRKKTYSVSKEGQTVVFVSVADDVENPDVFWSKLRLGLQEFKSLLPHQVILLIGDNNFGDASAMLFSLTSQKRTYRELETYLSKLEDMLRRNEKVSQIKRFGVQKEKIIIRVDSDKMAYYGINPSLIAGALELESLAGYGGEIVSGDL